MQINRKSSPGLSSTAW